MISVTVNEEALTDAILYELIGMSKDWEAENSCYGYRKNEKADIEGNRVFLARTEQSIAGYLFGHMERSEKSNSIMPTDTAFFEVEELYVKPQYRSAGIGKRLFTCAESAVAAETEFIMLSTATTNWRAILHFYIEELDI